MNVPGYIGIGTGKGENGASGMMDNEAAMVKAVCRPCAEASCTLINPG